jgi:REP element-mobilizing transposase RayT
MGHTFTNVLLHIAFSTKGRRPLIHDAFRDRLHEYLGGVALKEFGRPVKIGGTENHVHGLIVLGTDISLGEAMAKWKSLSSVWVHKTFPAEQDFAWQQGYGAFSVSESLADKVKGYIANQVEHHRKMSFEEEFVALLERHGIQYDPQRIWD